MGVRELRRTRVGREFSERDAFKALGDLAGLFSTDNRLESLLAVSAEEDMVDIDRDVEPDAVDDDVDDVECTEVGS